MILIYETNCWALCYCRFSQLEKERRKVGGSNAAGGQQRQRMPFDDGNRRGGKVSRGKSGGAVRKPRSNRHSNRMMDIDQVGNGSSGGPIGRFPMTTSEGGKKRGRGGSRRGGATAGGRGGSRGGKAGRGRRGKGAPVTKENLDKDLDDYMMKDTKTAKVNLDADLESYMMGVTDLPQTIG